MNDKTPRSKYLLVRWLEEESVGIMPSSNVHKEDKVAVGAVVRMKWSSKKYYDAEILKMSSKYIYKIIKPGKLVNVAMSFSGVQIRGKSSRRQWKHY